MTARVQHSLRLFAAVSVVVLLLFVLLRNAGRQQVEPLRATSVLMGTSWHIFAAPENHSAAELDLAVQQAFAEVRRIENLMSEWRPDSALSHLNRNAGQQPLRLPKELLTILRDGVKFGNLTHGAFDIAWLPLKPLWPFAEPFTPPAPNAVKAARQLTDYRRLVLDDSHAFLPVTGMAIGLGGIAKGYAIDRAAAVLKNAGIQRYLVDGGGDIRVASPQHDRPWKIGIRDPEGARQSFLAILTMHNGAVATSGNYEHYVDYHGHRYHHILNPHTGYPTEGTRQVSVITDSAETADAMATAFFVLPASQATALARQQKIGTIIIADDNRRLIEGVDPKMIMWVED